MAKAAGQRPAGPHIVGALGIRWPHNPGFTVARPHGLGMYLLLRFHSPVTLLTAEGAVSAEPGDCILYEPSFPQWYRGKGDEYVDDWIHLLAPRTLELVRRYELPVNLIFRPHDTEFVTPIFEAISRELRCQEPKWEEAVLLLVETLFLRLNRQLGPAGLTPAEEERVKEFRSLRMYVHNTMEEPWTVETMARRACMGRSHFATLYKKMIGAGPMEDLIRARLWRARTLLSDGGMSVAEAADRSGFRSVCHFSRLFRKHVGCAPRDYHRRPLVENGNLSSDALGERRGSLAWLEHRAVTQGWELLTRSDLLVHLEIADERSESRSAPTPTSPRDGSSRKCNRRSPVDHT